MRPLAACALTCLVVASTACVTRGESVEATPTGDDWTLVATGGVDGRTWKFFETPARNGRCLALELSPPPHDPPPVPDDLLYRNRIPLCRVRVTLDDPAIFDGLRENVEYRFVAGYMPNATDGPVRSPGANGSAKDGYFVVTSDSGALETIEFPSSGGKTARCRISWDDRDLFHLEQCET